MDEFRDDIDEYVSYEDFAYVYDELMDATPYEMWCDRICDTIEKYGVSKPKRDSEDLLDSEKNLVLDLGCGTGTLTELLYNKGYDLIGVDNSQSMLAVAMEKREKSGSEILYLWQDMRELELYSTVGTVVCVCDSLNYILEDDELAEVFSLVNNYLYPDGIFVFDFNTDYKYREVIGDTTIAENRDDCSFIWENSYEPESDINEYDLTVFVREDNGFFRRFNETHLQRGYSVERIKELVSLSGMEILKIMDADTEQDVTGNTERVYVVAKECGKQCGKQCIPD